MSLVSRTNPLSHYTWGGNCDGWNLVDEPRLSVKLERIPPGKEEQLHFHEKATQFFFILKGEAMMEIEGIRTVMYAGEGISVQPFQKHRILNPFETELEFLLSSQPSTAMDRINLA